MVKDSTVRIELNEKWDLVWPNLERNYIYYLKKGGRYGNSIDHLQDNAYKRAVELARQKGLVKRGYNNHHLTKLGKAIFNLIQ